MKKLTLVVCSMVLVLVACSPGKSAQEQSLSSPPPVSKPISEKPEERWYASQHVSQGATVFQENCAECHGKQGQGAPDWKKLGPDGKYPAPPLNGSGHAWHHPLKMLFHVVKNGTPGGQGGMPAWGTKLSDDEMIAAIAWFQAKWPDRIYSAWMQREMASRSNSNG